MSRDDRELVSAPEVTVCIACRNEEDNAEAIAAAVIAAMESVEASFDIIFIDNESTDRTVAIVKQMCARDPRIKLIVRKIKDSVTLFEQILADPRLLWGQFQLLRELREERRLNQRQPRKGIVHGKFLEPDSVC